MNQGVGFGVGVGVCVTMLSAATAVGLGAAVLLSDPASELEIVEADATASTATAQDVPPASVATVPVDVHEEVVSDRDRLRGQNRGLERRMLELALEGDQLRAELGVATHERDSARQERDDVRVQLAVAKGRIAVLEETVSGLNGRIGSLVALASSRANAKAKLAGAKVLLESDLDVVFVANDDSRRGRLKPAAGGWIVPGGGFITPIRL